MYVATGLLIVGAAAYRYWVAKKKRPTFASSLPDAEIARRAVNARQGSAISATAWTIGEAVGATTLGEVIA